MKFDKFCWIEYVPQSNTYKLGLDPSAHKWLGEITSIEVADTQTFECGQQIITASGRFAAIRIFAPMFVDSVLNTNISQFRSLAARPFSLGPRGGWVVEFQSDDTETFGNLSDNPVDI